MGGEAGHRKKEKDVGFVFSESVSLHQDHHTPQRGDQNVIPHQFYPQRNPIFILF